MFDRARISADCADIWVVRATSANARSWLAAAATEATDREVNPAASRVR